MKEWYLEPHLYTGTEKQEWGDYAQCNFAEVLEETPLGKDVYFCTGVYDGETETFETEIPVKAIIQNETVDAYTQGWVRQILSKISDKISDYKYVRYDGHLWLITTMPSDNTIYDKAVLHECNYTLKWQDKDRNIVYYPCFIQNATEYSIGVERAENVLHVPYTQLMAWMAVDELSLSIDRDMRYFIDIRKENPAVYKVTSTNHVPHSYGENRMMKIIFTEDILNPDTDRPDLMLCNYVEPKQEVVLEITYSGEPVIRTGGRKTFKVDAEDVIWEIVVSDEYADKFTLSPTDNSCVVKVAYDEDVVGVNFKLVAKSHGLTGEVLATVGGVV